MKVTEMFLFDEKRKLNERRVADQGAPDGRRDRRGEEDRRQTWISEISFSEWASHLAAFRKRALARQTLSRGTTASDALHTTGVKHRAVPNS